MPDRQLPSWGRGTTNEARVVPSGDSFELCGGLHLPANGHNPGPLKALGSARSTPGTGPSLRSGQ